MRLIYLSVFFLEQNNVNVRVLQPFYNTKDHTIVPLPETFSSSILYVSDDAVLPDNISEIDFAYEVRDLYLHSFLFFPIFGVFSQIHWVNFSSFTA